MNEIWRPVVGHEGRYEVSNMGRVRSVDRSFFRGPTPLFPKGCTINRRGKILAPGRQPAGHLVVALGRGNMAQVHRLVLEAFVGPCPLGHECAHWDDVPTNNWLENLRWATRSDKIKDAYRNGKKTKCAWHSNIKLEQSEGAGPWAIKAKKPVSGSPFKYVTPTGGIETARIKAARFCDISAAHASIELNSETHPGWQWKVVPL